MELAVLLELREAADLLELPDQVVLAVLLEPVELL
jgi:hypothetical protein